MRNPNSELKIINTVKFNVFVKDQTQLNKYNSELKPPTSKFLEQNGAFNLLVFMGRDCLRAQFQGSRWFYHVQSLLTNSHRLWEERFDYQYLKMTNDNKHPNV